jgi:hypothetical protein
VNVEHGRVVTTGIVPFTNTNRQLHPSTNSSSPDPAGDGFTPRSSSTTRGSTGVIVPSPSMHANKGQPHPSNQPCRAGTL